MNDVPPISNLKRALDNQTKEIKDEKAKEVLKKNEEEMKLKKIQNEERDKARALKKQYLLFVE